MQNATANPEPRKESAPGSLWLLQWLTGGLLILVLALHMIAQHFVVDGGLRDFAQVLAYVSNPLIFAIELVFLVVVTLHAVLGLRAIIIDLNPSEGVLRAANWILALLGAGAVVYGVWLALILQSMARS
jgi:succinate dehydrogenase / fumarate reductase membrane anchor subunit